MCAVSIFWSSAVSTLLIPSRIGNDLQYSPSYSSTCDEHSWFIDDPPRAWTRPLSRISSRVKGFNTVPYCPPRSSKKIHTALEHSNSSASHISYHPIESDLFVPVGEPISPAAINPFSEKFHPLEAIVSNTRHSTFLHPFWTLVPPLVPNNLDSVCSREALQVSSLSTLFRSEVLVRFWGHGSRLRADIPNPELDSRINNDPLLPPDFVLAPLTTVPFPLTYIGPNRTSYPARVQSLGDNFEPRSHPNNGYPVAEISSDMQMQPPTGQQCFFPLTRYDETFASIANRDSLVTNLGILQASSYPPPHHYGGGGGMDPPDRPRGSGKGKGREDSWQEEERASREGSAGGSAGGNNDESGSSRRRSKKTAMACHFCRKRKLKCDGAQPTCHTCAEKSLVCSYDEQIRRRGPGKKNRLAQQQDRQSSSSEAQQQPEPSSSSSSRLRTPGSINSPLVTLPRPPMPQYPYQLGTPPTGLESRIVSSRLASESRSDPERYMEEYPPRRDVYTTQQPGTVQPPDSYPQQQQPSTSYPGYQPSSYRDRDQPPPPPYSHQQQYYRQDYPSTSAHSIRRRSYVEEEEIEYASEDDNTTSSRLGPPSPEYEEDPRRRGGDPWQR